MERTRAIVLKVLVDCSWNKSRNTWKYENVVTVVFGNLGALRILPGVERDGFAHSPHSIYFRLVSIRDQLIKTSIYHLHTVCCSARGLRLGCWEHIILRITDLIQDTPNCEIDAVKTHLRKLCVIPRSRVLLGVSPHEGYRSATPLGNSKGDNLVSYRLVLLRRRDGRH